MTSNSCSSDIVSGCYIHDDVAFSILSKLPIKSLKRFECVRKSWSRLTEDSSFMTMYSKNLIISQPYEGGTALLIYINSEPERFHFLSGERFENSVSFISPVNSAVEINGFASVNGILCFHYGLFEKSISLWNPITEESKLIPSSRTLLPPIVHKFKAADSFLHHTMIHGFGYDSIADDYKVICLETFEPLFRNDELSKKHSFLLQHKSLQPFWQIYSLTSNSWKKLHVNMPRASISDGNFQVYMDGVCHWLSMPHWFCYPLKLYVGTCMVSFDLNNETFLVTPVPSYVILTRTQLLVLNDSIALISFPDHTQTFHISILGEVGVKESWIKLFTVKKPCACVGIPMGVGMNGEIVFANKDNELLLFDLNTKKIVELGIKRRGEWCLDQIKVYKKSLIPIKRNLLFSYR
ncbi:putative F-box domain-containing protein [Medicago truncatula]|uniref:F-box protein interaction domain protein n=1 Tax=Medicago truncatula TaxID=3880 RepID=G7K3H7_MEDTR|nr:F-box protein At2g40925 [Medicago truncatula]AET00509.1 F-box protein interaction domain protein [Medicago truncatula]RHN57788.1 putative F-box domain-containing protein [Medicago truncatula]